MSDNMQKIKHIIGLAFSIVVAALGLILEFAFPGNYLFTLIAIAFGYPVFFAIQMQRDIRRFLELIEKMKQGEQLHSDDMEGPLQQGVAALAGAQSIFDANIESQRETATFLGARMDRGGDALKRLEVLAEEQREMIHSSNKKTGLLFESLKSMSDYPDVLSTSAEESSSSILEMTMTTEEVAENMTVMGSSVRDTVSSIDQMAHTIKESADSIDTLSAAAEETYSSMTQIDRSIDQVQNNANETAKMAAGVSVDAERGAEAIVKTLETINRIKDSSQEAVNVISSLNEKIGAIGHILNVIDDVSEQTNLLALNAAIIAAQAGEHGKGFAVVADEIKELSERSGVSTKEIADLIKSIQEESRNAIDAVEQGNARVDEGVKVSAEAERALMQILDISKKTTEMMNAIARATVEQSYGSKQVTDAISRIAEHVQQIAIATAEQARGSELVISGAETMRSITQHVERSTNEQSKGGRQITESIEAISKKVKQIGIAYQEQQEQIGQLVEMSGRISQVSEEQEKLLAQIKTVFQLSGDSSPRILPK
jgi:methyl-accepting chemotaxis protein